MRWFIKVMCAAGMGIASLAGAVQAQSGDRHMDFHGSMSPSGDRIVYYSYREGRVPDLFILDVNRNREQRLTETPHMWETGPEWSPTGNRIAFARGESMSYLRAIIRDLDTGAEIDLGPGVDPAWSRDGSRIAWRGPNATIWVANADGSEARGLNLDHLRGVKSEPAWSFDGGFLTFIMEEEGEDPTRDVYLYELSSGGTWQLTDSPAGETGAFLLPDGDTLIFAALDGTSAPQVYKYTVSAGGTPELLTATDAGQYHYFPSLSPNPQTILFEAGDWNENRFFIYSLDIVTGTVRQLTGRRGRRGR
tara:strand:+ start:42437 stop:43354 length:918 start_codon:yes stop_codon:yes gene_type:complete